jgi:hypothetical protein
MTTVLVENNNSRDVFIGSYNCFMDGRKLRKIPYNTKTLVEVTNKGKTYYTKINRNK